MLSSYQNPQAREAVSRAVLAASGGGGGAQIKAYSSKSVIDAVNACEEGEAAAGLAKLLGEIEAAGRLSCAAAKAARVYDSPKAKLAVCGEILQACIRGGGRKAAFVARAYNDKTVAAVVAKYGETPCAQDVAAAVGEVARLTGDWAAVRAAVDAYSDNGVFRMAKECDAGGKGMPMVGMVAGQAKSAQAGVDAANAAQMHARDGNAEAVAANLQLIAAWTKNRRAVIAAAQMFLDENVKSAMARGWGRAAGEAIAKCLAGICYLTGHKDAAIAAAKAIDACENAEDALKVAEELSGVASETKSGKIVAEMAALIAKDAGGRQW